MTNWKTIARPFCLVATLFIAQPDLAHARDLGTWCDKDIQNWIRSITIYTDAHGSHLRSTFPPGHTPLVQDLTLRGGTYFLVDDLGGDRFRIRSDGDLQLSDAEGPIKVARLVADEAHCR